MDTIEGSSNHPSLVALSTRALSSLESETSLPVAESLDVGMVQHVERYPWNGSVLGPMEAWPALLRTTVQHVLGSTTPAMVLWGLELVQVFNDAYVPILGPRFRLALGRPAQSSSAEGWAANWEAYRELFSWEAEALRSDRTFAYSHRLDLFPALLPMTINAIRDPSGITRGILIGAAGTQS